MKTQQYNCPSYYDDEVKGIVDCTCGKCTIKHMKTYTQKQYDKAKLRAYKKGYQEASELITMDDLLENANDVKQWKKWKQFDISWTIVLLVIITLAVLVQIITYTPNF